MPENKRDLRDYWWLAAFLAFFIGIWYLHWRASSTFNYDDQLAKVISITVYVAEIYGFMAFVLFFLQVRKGPRRSPPDIHDYPSVDVFVTIYNESTDVLYRTLVCCQAMEYPKEKKRVYVLDDGNRKEVKELAERLGCHYLNRSTHEYAKAGNINYGLTHSGGEIVAIFDCDHIPVKSFLTETVGYFNDPKVAIVQTPHYFFNPDSFQRNLRLEKELSNEQDLFFRVIQPGRDRYNACFFAGSNGLFRRKALEEVKGIQTLTITEDLHTSMVLHAKGYKSVYVPNILAAGLSPESFEGYLKQRKRWTRGGLQVFLLDNPLIKWGLSFWQRIQYFGAVYYFLHSIPRMIYLIAPLSFLLFGYAPLRADFNELLLHFLPYYIMSLIAFHMVSRRLRNPFWSDVYETAMSFSITATVFSTFVNPGNKKFQVTPKGIRKDALKFNQNLVIPHMILLSLLVAGIILGFYKLFYGAQIEPDAFKVSIFWASYNVLLLIAAISTANERREVRAFPRLNRMIPGEIIFDDHKIPFITSDISESGMSIIFSESKTTIPLLVRIALYGDKGEKVHLKGMVMRNDVMDKEDSVTVGIHFIKLSEENRQSIVRLMFSSPHTWYNPPVASAGLYLSFLRLAISPFRLFLHEQVWQRYYPRIRKKITCELIRDGVMIKGIIEDISYTGMRARFAGTLQTDHEVKLNIYDSQSRRFSLESRIVWIKKKRDNTHVGFHFMEHRPEILELLKT